MKYDQASGVVRNEQDIAMVDVQQFQCQVQSKCPSETEIHFLVQSSMLWLRSGLLFHKPRVVRVRKLPVNHKVTRVPAA